MILEHIGLSQINGSLVVLDGVKGVQYDEMAELHLDDGSTRVGRVVRVDGDRCVIQVFEGTRGLSLVNNRTVLTGHPMMMDLSPELLGRVLDGLGRPIDGLGDIYPVARRDVNGAPINPVSRVYPRNYIHTGISSIDCLATLIRGQKLPIFSGSGMKHNELAVQIVRQASVADGSDFAIVFAAMGVKNDVASYFRESFESCGAMERVVMLLNLANDPIIERIITPRAALTVAEYLAFDLNKNVLVILTDMTSYCEALREFSSSKGEIPGRKGFPGYLYSDLASLYERAGIIKGSKGSVTQIPILTMPGDDITHPIPDLTGYITEGQIVLDRGMDATGLYPPVSVLPSLSRLMKDGIGAGYTREDHVTLSNQLFACYAKVQDAKALASVIGEEELSQSDKQLMAFGRAFEQEFIGQGNTDRTMEQTLDLGWELLATLPRNALDRCDAATLDKYYEPAKARIFILYYLSKEYPMAQQVFPTKSNLMATKRSLALATQGYDLMDRKRNILVREMMQLIDRAAGIQDRISAAYAEAYEALKKANIMLGSVGGYAAGVPVERGVQMSTRSVMGVELPTLRLNTTSPMGLYYDLESTNGTLDVAYLKFNEVKTLTVELAEVETSVIRLAEAIQKTQKRANALGNVQIPQMQKTIKSIDEVLSEREREEFSRLKVIKAQKEKEEA